MSEDGLDALALLVETDRPADAGLFQREFSRCVAAAMEGKELSVYVLDLVDSLPDEIRDFVASAGRDVSDRIADLPRARARMLGVIAAFRDELQLCHDLPPIEMRPQELLGAQA